MQKKYCFKFSFLLFVLCCAFLHSKAQEKVETDACFENGKEDWTLYQFRTIDSKIPYQNCAPEGTFCVVVRFLVEKNGSLVDIRPLTKFGFGMEEEIVRVIKQAPTWAPATQNGRKCRSYETLRYFFIVKKRDNEFL